MTPDDLIALAAKATPGPWHAEIGNFIVSPAHHVVAEVDCYKGSAQDFAYLVACSPERIAALCRVANSARLNGCGDDVDAQQEMDECLRALDAAFQRSP